MGLVERLDTYWEIDDLEIREDAVRRREVVGEHYVEGMRYLVCETEGASTEHLSMCSTMRRES